jgi:ubiquinone/menaquinone biosynthesis C-methylase UbiE
MNDFHEANRKYWDKSAPEWHKLGEDLWRDCVLDPSLAFEGAAYAMIRQFSGSLQGKKVCIIGSGDNLAAFALSKLGAVVTSTDISEPRLLLAEERAKALNLKIEFLRCDAAALTPLKSNSFDLVCSTNGFFVWISDLAVVFREVCRVLKPGGHYVFYDVHPFQRPWKEQTEIAVRKPYNKTGPFQSGESGQSVYNYHWTVADILNSLVESGLALKRISEDAAKYSDFWTGKSLRRNDDPALLDWQNNPRAALPVWLSVASIKN